jgi:hypothetical protein
MQHQHDDRMDRVAHKGGIRLTPQHYRDDQARLYHGYRNCQDQRAVRLSQFLGNHLSVVDGCRNIPK